MEVFSKIDIGKTRKSNQDACFTGRLYENTMLIIVCDGMGGANAGNVASEMAVKCISEYVGKSFRKSMNETEVADMLKNALISANIEIYDTSRKNSEYSGMGTTAVIAVVNNDTAVICHVGDSRAYLVNDNITQLTKDHSIVQSLIESGKLTPDEAKLHPRKNVITKALGAEEDIVPDIVTVKLEEKDNLLFCTDGLTNYVETPDILDVFKTNQINNVAYSLVERANQNGGGDNITVVTVTV